MNIQIKTSKDFRVLATMNETVQKLHNELYPGDFKPFNLSEIENAFERLLSDSSAYAFIAEHKENNIGYMLCLVKKRLENEFQYEKTVLYIDQISVEETYRNMGVAEQLLGHAFSLAREMKIVEIQMDHWEANSIAGKFFGKNGFIYFNHKMKKKN